MELLLVPVARLSLLIIDICSAFRDFTVFAQCSMRDAFSRAAWALLAPIAAHPSNGYPTLGPPAFGTARLQCRLPQGPLRPWAKTGRSPPTRP
jgi:hypothetical protein